jgi:hypothetical protein
MASLKKIYSVESSYHADKVDVVDSSGEEKEDNEDARVPFRPTEEDKISGRIALDRAKRAIREAAFSTSSADHFRRNDEETSDRVR